MDLEWARCMAIDATATRIYSATVQVTNAIGLTIAASVSMPDGNTTTLSLEAGVPHWLAFTCLDAAGQEDLANATVIGPVVPNDGNDDGLPPSPLTMCGPLIHLMTTVAESRLDGIERTHRTVHSTRYSW